MGAAVAPIHPEVAELRPGQRFEGRYACVSKESLTARNGSSYLALRLRDRSGTIAARVFRDSDRIGMRFEPGDAVAVRGRASTASAASSPPSSTTSGDSTLPGIDSTQFLPAAYRSV